MTARTITAAQLAEAGACEEYREVFDALFPSGSVRVTQKLAIEHAASFDWDWAARHLLSRAAQAEHDKVKVAVWAECREVTDAAYAEYCKVAAYAEYCKVAGAAQDERDKALARTFARLYNADGAR